jgi:hypothetical protein
MGTLFAHLTPEPPKPPRRSLLFRDVPADAGEEHFSSGRLRADKKPAHPNVIKAFADISAAKAARRSAQVRAWNALMAVVINLPPSV